MTDEKEEKICEEDGCEEPAEEWTLDYMEDGEWKEQTHVLCREHAAEHGFCLRCGGFYGGVESYHFRGIDGYCSDCSDALKAETGWEDEPDETWYPPANTPPEEAREIIEAQQESIEMEDEGVL